MAHIVPFRSTPARGPEEAACSEGAQIVIFPGVRRERHAEPTGHAVAWGTGRDHPRRDWLDLPDEPTTHP